MEMSSTKNFYILLIAVTWLCLAHTATVNNNNNQYTIGRHQEQEQEQEQQQQQQYAGDYKENLYKPNSLEDARFNSRSVQSNSNSDSSQSLLQYQYPQAQKQQLQHQQQQQPHKVEKVHVNVVKNSLLDSFDHRYPDGSYEFRYELADGTARYERGYFVRYNKQKSLVVVGYYSYRMPNGQYITVFYNADRFGYRQNQSVTRDTYPNLPRTIEIPQTKSSQLDDDNNGDVEDDEDDNGAAGNAYDSNKYTTAKPKTVANATSTKRNRF